MKAVEKNLETGAINGGSGRSALRHGLGNNPLIQPLELRPIAKIDATFFCPYCLKGTTQVYDQKILLKTKRQHLKVCAKAPVGSTARQMDIDWKKSRSVVHKREEKRLKVIKDLKKGKEMGVKKGHKPVVLPHSRNRNWPDFSTLVCQHCLACSNDRNGGLLKKCQGVKKIKDSYKQGGSIFPGTKWWEKYGRLNGLNNLFQLLTIPEGGELAKKIRKDVKVFRATSSNADVKTYRLGMNTKQH